jgi:hypothetical protein
VHEKAAKEEAKLSSELHKLEQSESVMTLHLPCTSGGTDQTAEHNAAASKVQATANDINTKTSEHQRLAQAVEQKKSHLNQLESQVSRSER